MKTKCNDVFSDVICLKHSQFFRVKIFDMKLQKTFLKTVLSSLYSHLWLSFCFFRLISDVLDFFVCDLALFSFKHDFLTPAKFAGGADGCFPPWNGTQEQLRFWQFHKVFFVPDVPLLFGIALIHDCWVFGSLSLEETWKPKNRALPLKSHSNQKQRTVNS